MVLDPIPQSLPVHFFGSRPQPPTSPATHRNICNTHYNTPTHQVDDLPGFVCGDATRSTRLPRTLHCHELYVVMQHELPAFVLMQQREPPENDRDVRHCHELYIVTNSICQKTRDSRLFTCLLTCRVRDNDAFTCLFTRRVRDKSS